MDICFVPSLLHLASAKIVTVLIDNVKVEVHCTTKEEKYFCTMFKVKESIKTLIPYNSLRRNLECFVVPILCEMEKWVDICEQSWIILNRRHLPEIYSNPWCWTSDGCIDREKSAEILVKNSDASSLNRFVFACIFCMFLEASDLWNNFWESEKAFLRRKYVSLTEDPGFTMRMWIEFLDNNWMDKDWDSFASYVFQTGFWKKNVYIMKHVFKTLSPAVRDHYLLEAFHENNVSIDVKRFGLMVVSPDEREVIIRKSPEEALKCLLPWPMRSVFVDLMDNLWRYVTAHTFCSVLCTILNMIKNEEKDYVDLLVLLKDFWRQSPAHCKKAAEKDSTISRPLNFVIKYDFSRKFNRRCFLNCYKEEYNYLAVNQIMPSAESLRNDSDEEYLFINRMFH